YTLCGVDKDGKALCIVTNYSNDDEAESREVKIDFGEDGKYEIYMLDDEHDAELISTTSDPRFTLKNHSFAMIKQI
ncbi:MAG: hypothetical protein IKJ91_12500, partial [Clostridia bacterium]|nr:hypothetical protein [Clostridia bacterium]